MYESQQSIITYEKNKRGDWKIMITSKPWQNFAMKQLEYDLKRFVNKIVQNLFWLKLMKYDLHSCKEVSDINQSDWNSVLGI